MLADIAFSPCGWPHSTGGCAPRVLRAARVARRACRVPTRPCGRERLCACNCEHACLGMRHRAVWGATLQGCHLPAAISLQLSTHPPGEDDGIPPCKWLGFGEPSVHVGAVTVFLPRSQGRSGPAGGGACGIRCVTHTSARARARTDPDSRRGRGGGGRQARHRRYTSTPQPCVNKLRGRWVPGLGVVGASARPVVVAVRPAHFPRTLPAATRRRRPPDDMQARATAATWTHLLAGLLVLVVAVDGQSEPAL